MLEKKKIATKTKHTDPLVEATPSDDVWAVVLEVVVGAAVEAGTPAKWIPWEPNGE
jgi:hypothetical protein